MLYKMTAIGRMTAIGYRPATGCNICTATQWQNRMQSCEVYHCAIWQTMFVQHRVTTKTNNRENCKKWGTLQPPQEKPIEPPPKKKKKSESSSWKGVPQIQNLKKKNAKIQNVAVLSQTMHELSLGWLNFDPGYSNIVATGATRLFSQRLDLHNTTNWPDFIYTHKKKLLQGNTTTALTLLKPLTILPS